MKYRDLPGTDLTLSEVGFGLWTVATDRLGKIEEPDGIRLLQEASELGVTFFDTADIYGKGYGEEVLARALPKQRHDIVIGTKFGYDFYNNNLLLILTGQEERRRCFDPDYIRYACEQSLRRLRTDYIDLYQIHNPTMEVIERDEVFETLEQLVKEGKIRYYAAALGPDVGWSEEGDACMRYRDVSALQIIYNILEQEPARSFFPIAEETGVGLISRVPHASEVLTDSYANGLPVFDPSNHRAHRKQEWLKQALARAGAVRFLAEDTGRTFAQSAIAFCLAQPSIVSVLPNLTNLNELQEYAAASETPPLSEEELRMLDELWREGFYLEQPAVVAVDGE